MGQPLCFRCGRTRFRAGSRCPAATLGDARVAALPSVIYQPRLSTNGMERNICWGKGWRRPPTRRTLENAFMRERRSGTVWENAAGSGRHDQQRGTWNPRLSEGRLPCRSRPGCPAVPFPPVLQTPGGPPDGVDAFAPSFFAQARNKAHGLQGAEVHRLGFVKHS
jgi:hypothetical protein